jgi:hypothetical protein
MDPKRPRENAPSLASAPAASPELLLPLLAARDARIGELEAALAGRDAAAAGVRAALGAELGAARVEIGALAVALRSAVAAADAERAFSCAFIARDRTLAAALAERDEGRRLMARPNARTALLGERLIDVLPIVAAVGFAAEVAHCLYLCGETWRTGDKGATNDMLVRSMEKQG